LLRPELRQYITRRFGFSFWKDDPSYAIQNHVKFYDGKFKDEFSAATVVRPDMILRASEEMLYGGFTHKRSPWELHVFQNYRDSEDSPDSTAMALRIHHSLGTEIYILTIPQLLQCLHVIPSRRRFLHPESHQGLTE